MATAAPRGYGIPGYRVNGMLWRRRDPIPRLAKHLLEEGIADQTRLDAIRREVNEEVQAAMRFAEESPEPDAAALYEGLFAESPEELVRDGSESAN